MDSGIKRLQVHMVVRPANMFRGLGVGGQGERTSTGDKAERLELVKNYLQANTDGFLKEIELCSQVGIAPRKRERERCYLWNLPVEV